MKIIFDGTGLVKQHTGMSCYIKNLVPSIAKLYPDNEYTIILNPTYSGDGLPLNISVYKKKIPNIGPIRDLLYKRYCRDIKREYDIYHCLTEKWPIGFRGGVCTIHDLRFYRRGMFGGLSALKSQYFKLMLRNAIKGADELIAVSHATKKDILKYIPDADNEKIAVVHHGFSSQSCDSTLWNSVCSRYGIREPYLLSVSEIKKHKNHSAVLTAFNKLKQYESAKGVQLAIVGRFRDRSLYRQLVKEKHHDVVFTGYVPDADLHALYAHAFGFVFLSLYEGFGFPLLEAMDHKIPILCSNSTALGEIVGDGALQVNPENIGAIEQGMMVLTADDYIRKELIAKGSERLKAFSWDRCANQVMHIYHKVTK